MPTPRLFLGRSGTPAILRAGGSYWDDDGTRYDIRAKTNKVAPAGAGGECIFTALYVVTTHLEQDVRFHLTPILDGVALATQVLDLVGVAGTDGASQVHEIGLSVPYLVGGIERLRVMPRGTWLEVLVATDSAVVPLDAQVIDHIEVEYEVVRESKEPV